MGSGAQERGGVTGVGKILALQASDSHHNSSQRGEEQLTIQHNREKQANAGHNQNSIIKKGETIVKENILSTIGHTPLVRLTRLFPDCPFDLFAKLEGFNPGGSTKDRPALHILREAMRTGAAKPWTVVIESR